MYDQGFVWSIEHKDPVLTDNLNEFLNEAVEGSLSSQAAAGMLVRSVRAKQPIPLQLFDLLWKLAASRKGILRPSRSNSFDLLEGLSDEIAEYRSSVKSINDYDAIEEDDL